MAQGGAIQRRGSIDEDLASLDADEIKEVDYMPNTEMISVRKNVTSRQTYAGLKTMPPHAYERYKMLDPNENRM